MRLKYVCLFFGFLLVFPGLNIAHPLSPILPDSVELPVRALWVTRWDYHAPEDIAAIVQNAEWAGFNVIFFQVRGNGTVFYPSDLEPLDKSLQASGSAWDPLAYAVARAHLSGLQLHAWVNVFPGWRGTHPPADSTQLWNAHRSWFLPLGAGFLPQPRAGYMWLNPVLPAVRQHLRALILELSEKYNLDGIHLDYIRYPGPGDFLTDSQNPAYRLFFDFQKATPEEWDAFRRSRISALIQDCRSILQRTNPKLLLSAAIFGDCQIGTRAFFQNSRRWVWKSSLDWVVPMTYTSDTLQFSHWLGFYRAYPKASVLPGILTSSAPVFWQELRLIQKRHFPGFSFFSYQAIFPHHIPNALAHQISAVFLQQTKRFSRPPETGQHSRPYPQRLIFSQGTFPLVSKQKIGVEFDHPVSPKAAYFLCWKRKRPGALQWSAALRPRSASSETLVTERQVTLAPRAGFYTFSVYRQDGSKKRLMRQFDIPLLARASRFHFESFWGPPLKGGRHLLVDSRRQVWVPAGDRVVVLDSTGRPTPFSPIVWGVDASGKRQKIHTSLGVCQDANGHLWVTNYNGTGNLLEFSEKGTPLGGIRLRFFPGDVTVAADSRFFILSAENHRWHVLSSKGGELQGSPFDGTHRSYGIAASENGASVFVSCRADGKVHHWAGSILGDRAGFQKLADLDVGDTGFGSLYLDGKNRLFVCQPGLGRIVVWDARNYRLLDVISGPMLRAPRAIAAIPGTHDYLILETSGETAVRLVRVREE